MLASGHGTKQVKKKRPLDHLLDGDEKGNGETPFLKSETSGLKEESEVRARCN